MPKFAAAAKNGGSVSIYYLIMTTRLIFLSDLSEKLSPVVRASIRDDIVEQYAANYREKRPMPPVVVFWDEKAKTYYLADGSHRCHAIAQIGRKAIEAEVRKGTYEDALQYALQANCAHGLQRSNADKRKCIKEALKQWPAYSNANLSKVCDVDDHTVAEVRKEMEAEKVIAPTPKRTSSSGRTVASQPVASNRPRKSEVEPPEPSAEPKPVVDKNGTPIPKAVIQYWERADEVTAILAQLTEVMNSLKQADKEKDLLFSEVNISAALSDLDKVRTTVGCAMPFAVCTQCAGHPAAQPKGECRLCLGRGMISKFRWDRLVPEEVRNMVMKGVKK
ncbi:MAG: hypothetical protein ACTS5I_08690 [Rhodanobacter sp.]